MDIFEYAKLVKGLEREKAMVWIGRDGCSIHHGIAADACTPCSPVQARFIISKLRFAAMSYHKNGVLYAA